MFGDPAAGYLETGYLPCPQPESDKAYEVSCEVFSETTQPWISRALSITWHKLTCWRPVSDVAGDVDHSVLSSVARRAECVPMTGTYWVRRRWHRINGDVAETHSDDEAAPWTHTQPHVGCKQTAQHSSTVASHGGHWPLQESDHIGHKTYRPQSMTISTTTILATNHIGHKPYRPQPWQPQSMT